VAALRAKRTVKPVDAIARSNAAQVIAAGVPGNHPLRLRDRSSAENPAYCGLYGMPLDNGDLDFLVSLAKGCIEVRKVADIDAA
jgi:hypothetical protein